MFSTKLRKGAPLSDILSYTLPKLHTGKTWYVDFMCYDPSEQKMKRKKYMLDGIEKITERRKRAADIIASVTSRLRSGWNPWVELSNSRQYAKVDAVLELYEKYLRKLFDTKAIKENTYLDYNKRIRVLKEYMQKHAMPILYIYQFNLSYISDFLDYILMDRDSSARTRNNYKVWLSSFCSWLVEKQYMEVNPCEHIKALKEEPKRRDALSPSDLRKLKDYLEKHNRHYLLVCRMVYYTFIRPEELTRIRLKDIYLKEQKIYIGGDISKNRKDAMVGLNDELIKLHERAKKKEEIEQSRTCFYDKLTLIYPEEVLDSVYQAIQLERDGYVYRQMSFLASEKDMREIYERLFKESNAHWSNWVKQVPGMERVSSFINNK